MRILWHEDCPLHEECRSGERRLYPRNWNADTTGTAGHAHAETLTAAHGSQGTCQDPQAEDQYDTKAARTHAWTPASSSLVGATPRERSTPPAQTHECRALFPYCSMLINKRYARLGGLLRLRRTRKSVRAINAAFADTRRRTPRPSSVIPSGVCMARMPIPSGQTLCLSSLMMPYRVVPMIRQLRRQPLM
jgi:hypothetical protein